MNTTASLIAESKQKKAWKKKIFIFLVLVGLGGGGAWYYFYYLPSQTSDNQEQAPEVAPVERQDLRTSIETDGKIINPDITNLSFLVNGTLDKIYVKEGDMVQKGEVIAELDKRDILLELRNAQNDVQIARANLNVKKNEIIDADLITSEQDYEISQLDLQDQIRELNQKVDQTYEDANLEIEKVIADINNALQKVDALYLIERHNSDDHYIIRSFHDAITENDIKNYYREIRRNLDTFETGFQTHKQDREALFAHIDQISSLAVTTKIMLDDLVDVFRTAVASSDISASEIDSARSSIVSEASKMNSTISSLTSTVQNIESTLLNNENSLKDTENSLTKMQTKLQNTKRNYENKELSKQTDLDVLQARIAQAVTKVEQAQYDLELTTLKSPIDGEIIVLNGNEGESIKADNTSADNAFVRIMSQANFTVEVNVEEVDITKITKGQKVEITIEAIEDVILEGDVTYISSVANSDNNGVVTYLVRVEITDHQNAPIKEGMTAYTEFIIGEAKNALTLPENAVIKRRDETSMVRLENGEMKTIKTGFSDGRHIEITEGLEEGDKVLISTGGINGRSGNGGGRTGGGGRELTDERIEQLKSAGFTDKDIENMKAGNITDEMRTKMMQMRQQAGGDGGFRGGAPGGFGGGRPR